MKKIIAIILVLVLMMGYVSFSAFRSVVYAESALADYNFDVVPAESIEDFYGFWHCIIISDKGLTLAYDSAIKSVLQSEAGLSSEEIDEQLPDYQIYLIVNEEKASSYMGNNTPQETTLFYLKEGKLVLVLDEGTVEIEKLSDGNICLNNTGGKYVFEKEPHALQINDEAELLKEAEKFKVVEAMQQLLPYANVGFMTCPSGGSSQPSAEKARVWGEKTFGDNSVFVVFIIDMTRRHLDIYASASLANVLTTSILDSITDKVYMKATYGHYADCAVNTFSLIRDALIEGEPSKNEFIFRGKIKWGMSESDVVTLEGVPDSRTSSDIGVNINYSAVSVSNYKGDLGYVFLSDRLMWSRYMLSDTDKSTFDYLRTALKTVYGDEVEADKNELIAFTRKMNQVLSDDSLDDLLLAKWETPDGTIIYLYMLQDETIVVFYFSPEFIRWSPEEEVNVTGL